MKKKQWTTVAILIGISIFFILISAITRGIDKSNRDDVEAMKKRNEMTVEEVKAIRYKSCILNTSVKNLALCEVVKPS